MDIAHRELCKPIYATLPWEDPFGSKQETVSLLLSTPRRNPIRRNTFDELTWNPSLDAAGIPRARENGTHALRHRCASMLLDAGRASRPSRSTWGHWDPGFMLRQYTHSMPSTPGTDASRDRRQPRK
ncbi:hypothetical protein [Dactylosporangium sp. NPDC048998]|uniref:hypothetical protein n=1 Tax=Dactylosporangium sp. NPDC048998 TaxID=3363976 RepID=UPI00371C9DA6